MNREIQTFSQHLKAYLTSVIKKENFLKIKKHCLHNCQRVGEIDAYTLGVEIKL